MGSRHDGFPVVRSHNWLYTDERHRYWQRLVLNMKRLLVTALLFFACTAANAEWTLFSTSVNKNVTWYTDNSTFRRVGDIVKIWVLADRVEAEFADGTRYQSSVELHEVNCAENASREIYADLYLSQMGTGTSLRNFNQPNIEWRPVPPATLRNQLVTWLCAQKPKP